MATDLVAYISAQLQQGYALPDIQNALLQQGYTAFEIEDAAKQVQQQRIAALTRYLSQQSAPESQLREQLLQLGYADADIREAFAATRKLNSLVPLPTPQATSSSTSSRSPTPHHHGMLVLLLLILIAGGGYWYWASHAGAIPTSPASKPALKTSPLAQREVRAAPPPPPATPAVAAPPAKSAPADLGEAASLCRSTADERQRNACFDQLAKSLNDPNYCGAVTDVGMKDTCFLTLVLRNRNYALCSSITNERLKRECSSLAPDARRAADPSTA